MHSDLSFLSFLNASSESSVGLIDVVLSILVCVILSVAIAVSYEKTHAGASFSHSFVQTIILGSLVSTIMIFAIGNNVARGLGILGALTIIRFRTPIRDPRDMIFIFASLAVGVACGSRLYGLAVVGTVAMVSLIFLLDASPYSSRKRFDGMLRFVAPNGAIWDSVLSKIVKSNTKKFDVVATRPVGDDGLCEYAVQIRLLHPRLFDPLVAEVNAVSGVSEVSLVMQRDTVEL